MKYDFLNYSLNDSVATVCLNRPDVHNAFNDKLIEEITNCFEQINQSGDIALVVLTGEGRSFCAGADLNWMSSMINYSMEENIQDSEKLNKMFEAIDNCQLPVIGKINGHALGGGVGIVAVCDYAITHAKAKFGFTEARLGLIPAVISPYCIKKIGESHARAWFMSGEMFLADHALKINLVHEVASLENFESRFMEVVESFKKAAPVAAKDSKKLIKDVLTYTGDDVSDYTCRAIAQKRISDEGQEGMKALLEKRSPSWQIRE